MSGFTCKAAAAQDGLKSAILSEIESAQDPVAFDGVGHPGAGLKREHMWIVGGFRARMPHRISGGRQRDEETSLQVKIMVSRAEPVVDVRDRAWALAELVEDAVSADPTLGGIVQEAHVSGVDGDEGIKANDRQYGLTVTVDYSAMVAQTG